MRRSALRLGPNTRQQWQQANSSTAESNSDSLYADSSFYTHSALGDDDSKAPTLDLRELPDSSLDLDFSSDRSRSVSSSPSLSPLSSRLSSTMWSTSSRPTSQAIVEEDESRLLVPEQVHAVVQRHSLRVEAVEQELDEEEELPRMRPRRPLRRPQKAAKKRWFSRFRCLTVRSKIISCLLSGVLLATVLSTYLGLALSTRSFGQQFHVPLILLIIFTSIYFCHALVRLCMLALQPRPQTRREHVVVLDEEAAIGNGPSRAEFTHPALTAAAAAHVPEMEYYPTKLPPPAYGNWRGSVRVNPNHVRHTRFPVRPIAAPAPRPLSVLSIDRPPSYLSVEGVEFTTSGAPRLTLRL